MTTSNMIYQAATAHQAELRRTGSRPYPELARSGGPNKLTGLLSLVRSHALRAQTATQPARPAVVTRQITT